MSDSSPPARIASPLTLIDDEDTGDRLLVYVGQDGAELEIQTAGDEPWFTQKQLSEIFGVDVRTVNEHVLKFIKDGELGEGTIRKFRMVRQEGTRKVSREIDHYALDVAMYVGYRVNSAQGVLFRKWATRVLTAFATQGFVVNKRRLKDPEAFDRLRALRDTINEIRASDVPLYAELRRICALCQDYDPSSPAAREFYARMRAKLCYAVTSHTPSMLIAGRADAAAPNMGMLSWSKEEPLQADAVNATSYLAEGELRELSNLTVILLDVIADQLELGRLTLMTDAMALVDAQLKLLGRPVLGNGGSVSADRAEAHAKEQYRLFDAHRKAARTLAADREIGLLISEAKALPKPPRKPRKPKA